MEKRYLECSCSDPSHVVRFSWQANEPSEEFQELYMEIQTKSYLSFFGRIWVAFKYIFNIGNISWSDTLLRETEVLELRNIIDEYLTEMKIINDELIKNIDEN